MADWLIEAGKAANILEHHSFAIFEHGTAVYLGKDDIGKDHDHVRTRALEFFKAHHDKSFGDFGYLTDTDDEFLATLVDGYKETVPNQFGGVDEAIALKVIVSPKELAKRAPDSQVYTKAKAIVQEDAKNPKVVYARVRHGPRRADCYDHKF